MLAASERRIEGMLDDRALTLDVGGWASPWPRADWVLDVMPYETRGLYGGPVEPERERFSSATWVQRDICSHEPWPFRDKQFDFALCSHTLEDVRDPIWVCHELNRVAKAGYVEVPSRLEEQTFGIHGPWVGWAHHHWLVDIDDGGLRFVFKSHALHGLEEAQFPRGFAASLTEEQRAQALFWTGGFSYEERLLFGEGELDRYLGDFVSSHRGRVGASGAAASPRRAARRLRRTFGPRRRG